MELDVHFPRSGVRQFQVAEPQSLRSTVLFNAYRFHCPSLRCRHTTARLHPSYPAPFGFDAATKEIVKAETISGPWCDESAHLGVCSDRALIARHPPLRPADLLAAGAQAAPALRPGPNTRFHAPSCRGQTARPPQVLPRPASRWAGCQAASNPLGSCG